MKDDNKLIKITFVKETEDHTEIPESSHYSMKTNIQTYGFKNLISEVLTLAKALCI